MAKRGSLQSGATLKELTRIRAEKVERIIEGNLAIRKELAATVPDLATDASLSQPLSELIGLIEASFKGLHEREAPWLQQNTPVENAIRQHNQQAVAQLAANANRGVEILKREVALNLHKASESSFGNAINTAGGSAIINLGVIHGNVQQVIGDLNAAGQSDLADVLDKLAHAIEQTLELGNRRHEYLEQVQFIAKEAVAPSEKRQVSVVRGVFEGLRARLQDVANMAQILALAGPTIAHHFGYSWLA